MEGYPFYPAERIVPEEKLMNYSKEAPPPQEIDGGHKR